LRAKTTLELLFSSVLSNPKFAKSARLIKANFGFWTLVPFCKDAP
jgi:hypothetical protein